MAAALPTATKQKLVKSSKSTPDSAGRYRIFQDKLLIGFLITNIMLCAFIIVLLVLRVRPRDFVVPLQYSTVHGFDVLGSWYRVYVFGAFSLLVTLGNIVLAAMSYKRSRLASFLLVFGAIMVNLFDLIIVLTLVSHLEL